VALDTFADMRGRVSRVRSILVGREIDRVDYVSPASAHEEVAAPLAFDGVRMGIELATRDGATCAVAWQMAGVCEGLVVGQGRVESLRSFDMELRRENRTQSSRWQPFIGAPVRAVDVSWQQSAARCPPTLWAIHLQFDAQALTIALGEAGSDGPRYQPDELLVIFDSTLAAAYRIPAAIENDDDDDWHSVP
jgi:hypothetical protein